MQNFSQGFKNQVVISLYGLRECLFVYVLLFFFLYIHVYMFCFCVQILTSLATCNRLLLIHLFCSLMKNQMNVSKSRLNFLIHLNLTGILVCVSRFKMFMMCRVQRVRTRMPQRAVPESANKLLTVTP